MVLAQAERIDLERLEAAFEGLHTTSPSGAIFASIDLTRDLLAERGAEPRPGHQLGELGAGAIPAGARP